MFANDLLVLIDYWRGRASLNRVPGDANNIGTVVIGDLMAVNGASGVCP